MNNLDIEYIKDTGLTIAAKSFLFELVLAGFEVEIYDSFSELIFSKGFIWIRECDSFAYYAQKFEELAYGTKVALVRRDLIRDFELGSKEDQDQIREMKRADEPEDQDETENA